MNSIIGLGRKGWTPDEIHAVDNFNPNMVYTMRKVPLHRRRRVRSLGKLDRLTKRGARMKRHRPRNRKPYRDNVLTVPATPERFQLEERKIREAWNRNQPLLACTRQITLEPGEETQIEVDGVTHTIVNSTGERISFSPYFGDKSKDN